MSVLCQHKVRTSTDALWLVCDRADAHQGPHQRVMLDQDGRYVVLQWWD